MKKALMLASVASMIDQFNMPNIKLLLDMGYAVDVVCNFKEGNTCSAERVMELKDKLRAMNVRCFQVDFARNISHIGKNLKALRQVEHLMKENTYAFCHCHSPIGGVVARLAGHKTKTKIIYTAHGFHFYKGAPVKNWLLFYPVEKFLSRWTDTLLVINKEDYELAHRKFHMKHLEYIPGVGIEVRRQNLSQEEKEKKREKIGIPQSAFLLTCVAEFTKNKNQKTVIHAIEKSGNSDIYYVMCGIGPEKAGLEQYVSEHGLGKNIRFLGFRDDIHEILQSSDCFVLSSFREGLSVALMEAMAEGLPVVCGRIRGNVDLVQDGVGGYLIDPGEEQGYRQAFQKLYEMKKEEPDKLHKMGQANLEKIRGFSREAVEKKMQETYHEFDN